MHFIRPFLSGSDVVFLTIILQLLFCKSKHGYQRDHREMGQILMNPHILLILSRTPPAPLSSLVGVKLAKTGLNQ